jgi:hypothetical protein
VGEGADWTPRDQSSDAAMPGDIEAASTFSMNAVFSMICMIALTLRCVFACRSASAWRTTFTWPCHIAILASSAPMKLDIERPASLTIRSSTANSRSTLAISASVSRSSVGMPRP